MHTGVVAILRGLRMRLARIEAALARLEGVRARSEAMPSRRLASRTVAASDAIEGNRLRALARTPGADAGDADAAVTFQPGVHAASISERLASGGADEQLNVLTAEVWAGFAAGTLSEGEAATLAVRIDGMRPRRPVPRELGAVVSKVLKRAVER